MPIEVNKLVTNKLDYQIMENMNEKVETKALSQIAVSGSLPLFKCKCGYETSNNVAWCVHSDCCNGNDR